jgi:hypothetical protein
MSLSNNANQLPQLDESMKKVASCVTWLVRECYFLMAQFCLFMCLSHLLNVSQLVLTVINRYDKICT